MQKRIFGLFILGVTLYIIKVVSNEYIEPHSELSESSLSSGGELPFRVSLRAPSQAKALMLLNARNTDSMSQKKLREKHPYYYRIQPPLNKITGLDYLEQPVEGSDHCLTSGYNQELLLLLKEAQICESPEVERPPENFACTSNYTLPYMIVEFSDGAKINIGEKQSSCDYPTTFCGEINKKILTWVQKVLSEIKQLNCALQ